MANEINQLIKKASILKNDIDRMQNGKFPQGFNEWKSAVEKYLRENARTYIREFNDIPWNRFVDYTVNGSPAEIKNTVKSLNAGLLDVIGILKQVKPEGFISKHSKEILTGFFAVVVALIAVFSTYYFGKEVETIPESKKVQTESVSHGNKK